MKFVTSFFTYSIVAYIAVHTHALKAMEQPLSHSLSQAVPLFIEDAVSKDFIIRWEFAKICDFVFDLERDESVFFNPSEVKAGDLIFLRGMNAPQFFKDKAPLITVPYVIVTHGFYKDSFKEEYLPYLEDPNLIAWFGVHPCEQLHEKFYPLPLGVNAPNSLATLAKKEYSPTSYCTAIEGYNDLFKNLRNSEKTNLLYSNFTPSTHEDRIKVAELFNDKDFCLVEQKTEYKRYLEHMFCLSNHNEYYQAYLKQMASCKFVLSPRGAGIDCYRNWAALLVGCIPILVDCQLKPLFQDLPVLLVDKWEDITEEFLNYQYEKITAKQYSLKKLYCSYWLDTITQVKKEFLEKK